MKESLFVSGIGTNVGKTIVSAILVEKLKADYWKPIQSGDLDTSDTIKVRGLLSNDVSKIHPEAYRFTQPYSPHKSAEIDGVEVRLEDIVLPTTNNHLVIEGAGGLMVPLSWEIVILDLIMKLKTEVVLVSQNYLGSINHTLMSIEVLKQRHIPIRGIIFNGVSDEYSEQFIVRNTAVKVLGRIPLLKEVNLDVIKEMSKKIVL